MNEQIKVGDVVAWADVEDGMMVSDGRSRYVRIDGRGTVVYEVFGVNGEPRPEDSRWCPWVGGWPWSSRSAKMVKVEAIGLMGHESAGDLRRAAEVFEVRDALRAVPRLSGCTLFARIYIGDEMLGGFSGTCEQAATVWAERLHAAGWHPRMSAEDARRLLARA